MSKQIMPVYGGKPEERAAHSLIHYFKLAIGEEVFRTNGGDLEAEICSIVQDILEAAQEHTVAALKAAGEEVGHE